MILVLRSNKSVFIGLLFNLLFSRARSKICPMQTLIPLKVANPNELELLKIEGEYDGPIRRFVFSTAETATIVNDPKVMGMDYTEKLEAGIMHLLQGFLPHQFDKIDESAANVLVFLRGGLNFGLRNALHRAYGWNSHRTSYMSSQRAKDEQGRWYIKEDGYRKLTVSKGSVVFCGDVVATGVTLEHGLRAFTEALEKEGKSMRYFVFFTFGCHKAEKILNDFHAIWKSKFPDFEGIDLFYVEGKFHLADSKTPVTIKLQGTDLLRRDSLLAPRFIAAQEQSLLYPCERCTIYDAGSRAFDTEEYEQDVHEYWGQVLELAQKGMTAEQYLAQRFPEASLKLLDMAKKADLEKLCEEQMARF